MAESPVRILDRYAMYESFAGGGMAVVHFGRVRGAVGFSRLVAVKKLHPHFSSDPEFVAMFLDEARLAARVQHPNVVQTLDAVSSQGELFVILEYIHGESLSQLLKAASEPPSPAIAAAVIFGVLEGLHAAHEARDERGEPLELVHRDVSPQNVLVGTDGSARVLDFGIAKARGRSQVTRDGAIKGKLAYMAPEHIVGNATRRSDVFAASVCLWEALTAQRLFEADDEGTLLAKVLQHRIESPAVHAPELPPELVQVVMRGLAREADERFSSAREMALALQASMPLATPIEVGAWVKRLAGAKLAGRAARVAAIEHSDGELRDVVPSNANAGVTAPGSDAPPVGPVRPTLATVPESLTGVAVLASRERVSSRRRARLAALVAVASVSVVGALVLRGALHARAASPVIPATAASASVASASSSPVVEAPPPPPPGSAMTTAAAAAAAPVPPPSSAPVLATAAPSPHVARSHPAAAKKNDCSPAYTVDSLGMRHYKPECF